MFPASTILRYVAVVFPVLLYYFQSAFLATGDELFVLMLIGTAVTAGLQDSLTGLTSRLQFAQERGTLETYLVEPVPWALIPVAMNIWRSITGAALACIMVGVGTLLGAPIRPSAIPLPVLLGSWLGEAPQLVSLAPNDLADVWISMEQVAGTLAVPERGRELVARLQQRMAAVVDKARAVPKRPTVAAGSSSRLADARWRRSSSCSGSACSRSRWGCSSSTGR